MLIISTFVSIFFDKSLLLAFWLKKFKRVVNEKGKNIPFLSIVSSLNLNLIFYTIFLNSKYCKKYY